MSEKLDADSVSTQRRTRWWACTGHEEVEINQQRHQTTKTNTTKWCMHPNSLERKW